MNGQCSSRPLSPDIVQLLGGGLGPKKCAWEDRSRFCLSDDEVLTLGRWACLIEKHYSKLSARDLPMDIEWAKDGITGDLFVVQARPETVHSAKLQTAAGEMYRLKDKPGRLLISGQAVGEKIGAGPVRVVRDITQLDSVCDGEILVGASTDPDWEPVMRRVAAIVTDQGGRTAHAAIVSREFGIPCIVGAGNATSLLVTGQEVTVSCAEGSEGRVYEGRARFEVEKIDAASVPATRTKVMLTVGDPSQAFRFPLFPIQAWDWRALSSLSPITSASIRWLSRAFPG